MTASNFVTSLQEVVYAADEVSYFYHNAYREYLKSSVLSLIRRKSKRHCEKEQTNIHTSSVSLLKSKLKKQIYGQTVTQPYRFSQRLNLAAVM